VENGGGGHGPVPGARSGRRCSDTEADRRGLFGLIFFRFSKATSNL
jgi:hypothetical protein